MNTNTSSLQSIPRVTSAIWGLGNCALLGSMTGRGGYGVLSLSMFLQVQTLSIAQNQH